MLPVALLTVMKPVVTVIETVFPKLRGTNWRVSSQPDDRYNYIAWAANVTADWWWPVGSGNTYWPEGVSRSVTVRSR